MVYFNCEDCALEAARFAEHGGAIFRQKFPSADVVSSPSSKIPNAT